LKDFEFFLNKDNCNTDVEEVSVLTISSCNITDHNSFRINYLMEWSERGENLFQN